MLKKIFRGIITTLSLLVLAQFADARPYIDIDSSAFRPYPLALTQLKTSSDIKQGAVKNSRDFVSVIRANLAFSGYFKMLDERGYIAPEKDGITAAAINFSNWINVGAEGLIVGQAEIEKGKLTFLLRLFETATNKMLWEKTYTLPNDDLLRALAHEASNDIVNYFTSMRGIFDTRIAYIMKLPGREELRIMDYDGENDRALVRNGALNLLPAWDPAGEKILFTSYIAGNPNLYQFDLKTARVQVVSQRPGLNTGAQYSPCGKKIALTLSHGKNSEVYVIEVANPNNLVRLTNDWGIDTSPSWSPDGKQIVFVSTRSGRPHLYLMNADGSNQRRLTFKGEYNQTPRWSPKGDMIAFTARDERNVFDIFTINPETQDIRRLTQDQGNNEEPSWSPNGQYIAFTSTRDGTQQIYIMNADGSNQRRITNREWAFTTPAWQPWTEATKVKKAEEETTKTKDEAKDEAKKEEKKQ